MRTWRAAKKAPSFFVLVAMILFVVAPLSWMVSSAFKSPRELISDRPSLLVKLPTLENFEHLQQGGFFKYFGNSLLVATIVSVVTTIVGALAAYPLSRSRRRTIRIVGTTSLFAYAVAPIMLAIPYVYLSRLLGLTNTLLGLSLAHIAFCLPFAIWTLKAFFDTLPERLEDQGTIDGLSLPEVLWRVILPLAAPGVLSTAVFAFILSWNEYVFARVLIDSDLRKTLPIGIEDMFSISYVDWGLIMAAGVVMLVPAVILVLATQRYMRQSWFRGWQ